ncbi:hypothetical protein ACIBI9_28700 [Nonomuraea sp. NPDC050451]|uniref:hypothetical protein n=1 Tax=Nonomuraea sp. NPDC050451 TaxID=3364364 RepID=UPI0037B10955
MFGRGAGGGLLAEADAAAEAGQVLVAGLGLYTGTLAVLAAVSVYGRAPSRRRNARTTLALLVRTRGAAGPDEEPGGQ